MNQTLHFILCPDKACARRLRRELAIVGGRVGLQVGTWPELLTLAFRSCCLAPLEDDWHERLETAAAALPDAFWAASLAADSDNALSILATALRDVICAVPPGTSLPEIPESFPKRARRQLDDLRLLYAGIDHELPQDLAQIKAVIESPVQRFMRTIRITHDERLMELNPWQQALVNRLNHDAADAGQEQCFEVYFTCPDVEVPPSLQSMHAGVFAEQAQPVVLDDSVQWLAVRDPLEEVEVVSGMIQTALATGEIESPSGIGILLPAGSDYAPLLREMFASAGLPLSGLEVTECRRDLGRELLTQFLLVRCPEPTPLMALTSLLTSPLMPWSPGRGQYFAHRLMQNGIGKLEQLAADDEGSALLALLGTVDTCAETLATALDDFAALLSKHPELASHRTVVHDVIAELRAALEIGDELEWERLLEMTRPQVQSATEPGPITREGIAVFHEDEEPWRQVGQLYVLGFADGHYPRGLPVAAILADAEREMLNATGQWHFTLDGDVLERRRARFQRQLCTATTRITFLLPRYDLAGEAVAPSSTLAFMSRHFSGIGEPDELLLELDRAIDCARVVGLPDTTGVSVVLPRTLRIDDLEVKRDLRAIRRDREGNALPESPSGLETLMVSPLAWVLDRLRIESREWVSEGLDQLMKGTLAHAVFEKIFAPGVPLPPQCVLGEQVVAALEAAMSAQAPHLLRPVWRVERRHLLREIQLAAHTWHNLLEQTGARVVGAEAFLQGKFLGRNVRGFADVLLQLPSGLVMVVDYKKSSSSSRVKRMEKGYDIQASLYRMMISTSELPDEVKDQPIGVMYYLMNDQQLLSDTALIADRPLPGLHVLGNDISSGAQSLLAQRFAELAQGILRLNFTDDMKVIERGTGIKPYALEHSPLLQRFSRPESDR